MLLLRFLRSPNVGGVANWTGVLQVLWPLLGLGAALSFIASAWDSVYAHGWGAAVFAGLAMLCALTFVVSFGAIAFRYFRPVAASSAVVLPAAQDGPSLDRSEIEDITEGLHTLATRVAAAYDALDNHKNDSTKTLHETIRRLAKVEEMLKPHPMKMTLLGQLGNTKPHPTNALEALEQDIVTANDRTEGARVALVHMIGELKDSIELNSRQNATTYGILVSAIRARDAIAILKGADAIVLELGQKLIQAGAYKDDQDWKVDFVLWREELQKIDKIVGWWTDHHSPFLHITSRQLESAGYVAPSHIVTEDDSNRVRYKTTWIAQQSYTNQRDSIFAFFDSKAGELPG